MLCVGHHDSKELKLHIDESLHNERAASNRPDARMVGKFFGIFAGLWNKPSWQKQTTLAKNSFRLVEKRFLCVIDLQVTEKMPEQ